MDIFFFSFGWEANGLLKCWLNNGYLGVNCIEEKLYQLRSTVEVHVTSVKLSSMCTLKKINGVYKSFDVKLLYEMLLLIKNK